ncbi:MAG: pyridoxamine 5'-phosphate oxidase family protein [Chloroflexi bacterium]|nr:pyridoxamine 5'-phosphate oxidase family protein [Chloroflexota bacterium]
MGKLHPVLDERLAAFIRRQKLFFVATAPLSGQGHINLSPKGLDTFAILDDTTVAYLDLPGSGAETIAHLKENGRIVIMLCAFDGPPNIVRLHGRGEVVEPSSPDFQSLLARFPRLDGVRSIIRVRLHRISDSCGYGVPLFTYAGERKQLVQWVERKGPEGIRDYQRKNNVQSIDGLAGLSDGNA